MKQQHVTGFERDELSAFEQSAVVLEVVPEELLFVEPCCVERQGVAAGDDFQGAVFCGFGAECQPGAEQFGSLEGPVAEVLVPFGAAGELRLLGHDTVVVSHREDEVVSEQWSEAVDQFRIGGPLGEQWVSLVGLSESSDGGATDGVSIGGCPGVPQVRFVLDRSTRFTRFTRFIEFAVDGLEQLGAGFWRGETTDDEESVTSQIVLFFERECARVVFHGYWADGGP